jgi:hypothetical protein
MRLFYGVLAVLVGVACLHGDIRYDPRLGTLPQGQGFYYSGDGDNPAAVISPDALLHENTTAGEQFWGVVTDSSIDLSGNLVVEARLHIISSNYVANVATGTREGYYFFVGDKSGTAYYSLGLASNGFNINSITSPNQPLSPYPVPITDGLHTFRIVISSRQASFYLDGLLLKSGVGPFSGPSGYALAFGGVSGVSRNVSDLQYFCATTSASSCIQNNQTSVTPNRGGNAGQVTALIAGSGFQDGAIVKLTGLGADIAGMNTGLLSSFAVGTTFNLTGATPGVRNVVVTNPDNTVVALNGAFTVEQGGAAQLSVEIIGREEIRIGTEQRQNHRPAQHQS